MMTSVELHIHLNTAAVVQDTCSAVVGAVSFGAIVELIDNRHMQYS